MTPAIWVLLIWFGFGATHLGLASVRVEPGLRARIGDSAFLGLYSLVAFAFFVPLIWIYFGNRHAGPWLWVVPVGPALRVVLYAAMTVSIVLVVRGVARPSPASLTAAGQVEATGVYRITRHPLTLGLGLLLFLHMLPSASTTDLAFFGGGTLFSVAGSWHQDQRKLHAGDPTFRTFHAATPFLPFSQRGALLGLTEIPPAFWALGIAASFGIRWLHGSIWPH